MANKLNLKGQRFNRLLVLQEMGRDEGLNVQWLCLCDCGIYTIVASGSLRALKGKTESCGCLGAEKRMWSNRKHGYSTRKITAPEYRCWQKMKARCSNKKQKRYADYGGRGIKVCERWLESFENFLEDMGLRPSPNHSIDRFPDVNGNYEPTNCRWGTTEQQSRGKRNNRWIEYNGEKMVLADWAKRLGVASCSIGNRLRKGQSFESIYQLFINKPKRDHFFFIEYNGEKKNLTEWANELHTGRGSIRKRIDKGQNFSYIFKHLKKKHERRVIRRQSIDKA